MAKNIVMQLCMLVFYTSIIHVGCFFMSFNILSIANRGRILRDQRSSSMQFYNRFSSYRNEVINDKSIVRVDKIGQENIDQNTRTPTIDSDLLRFMSYQSSDGQNYARGDSISLARINLSQVYINNLLGITNDYGNVDQTDDDETQVGDKRRIAFAKKVENLLISFGATVSESRRAGITLQNYAANRFHRTTVHRFLKYREEFWSTNNNVNFTLSSNDNFKGCDNNDYVDKEKETSKLLTKQFVNMKEAIKLLLDAGLTANDCAIILTHTPSVAFMRTHPRKTGVVNTNDNKIHESSFEVTLEDTLNTVLYDVLFDKLRLRKYDARKILRMCPGLLTMRGAASAEQHLEIFSSLGLSPKSLSRDIRFLIVVFSKTPSHIFRLVAFLSSDLIRMRFKDIGPFIRNINCKGFVDSLCPTIYSALSSNVGDRECDKLLIGQQHNLDLIYKRVTKTSMVLRDVVGIDDMKKMVASNPNVLLLDPTTQILPVAEFLYTEVGIEALNVSKVLESYPSLFSYNLEDMRKTVMYLLDLNVPKNALAKIVRAFPSILTFSKEEQMEPVVGFLVDIGIVNVARVITRLPPILGYSVENDLKPKWDFLRSFCGYDCYEIVRFPGYFSFPLQRIQIRYQYLAEKGIPLRLPRLDTVLSPGDRDFANVVAGDKDSGETYQNFSRQGSRSIPKRNPKKIKKK